MLRSLFMPLLGAVLVVGLGQVVLAVDGPSVDQPTPADRTTIVQPAPADRTIIVQPAPSDRAVIVEPAAPADRAMIYTDAGAVHHISTVNKLPSGSLSAVETAVPGGTIVDVDKLAMRNAWKVRVVDQQGRLHDVRVDKNGHVVNQKDVRHESDELAELPTAVKSAVKQRYPDAVMYNTEVTVEDGKKVHEVEILSLSRRIDVKVRPSGEILEVETDRDDVGHDPDTRSSD